MNDALNSHQKYKLHLLLRSSLKGSNPIKAMNLRGIEPSLFTDIFLRADLNRQISYSELEQLSYLCCRVINWRGSQCPEVDLNRTYAGQIELLLKDLSGNTSSLNS